MPKRKTVDADAAPAEAPKRSSATKPKAPAATHKRATKKQVEPAAQVSEPVRTISHQEIARLAYSYWEARGFQGGDPQEDWFRAERELFEFPQNR